MKVSFGCPVITNKEKSAVATVLSNPILVHGSKSKEFEKNFSHYTKSPYAITVSSCTAGMHLIYFSLGFKKFLINQAGSFFKKFLNIELIKFYFFNKI